MTRKTVLDSITPVHVSEPSEEFWAKTVSGLNRSGYPKHTATASSVDGTAHAATEAVRGFHTIEMIHSCDEAPQDDILVSSRDITTRYHPKPLTTANRWRRRLL